MISRIRGIILEKEPPLLILETGGISYEIHMPMTCFYRMPNVGKEIIVLTHLIIREDSQLLFGFNNQQERIIFRELIKTNGIGPKLAQLIMSGISIQDFINVIEQGDFITLSKIPGIGKKIAERLVVELKDRFKEFSSSIKISSSDLKISSSNSLLNDKAQQEAVAALISLGYKNQEANRIIKKIAKPNTSSEYLIREALRTML